MESLAIIGAGISGLAVAHLLKQKYKVVLFEKETVAGGLIRCIRVNGSLYHICGGHVFNSKKQNVLDWFWNRFDKDCEFSKAIRNSVVFMTESKHVPYPIENYVYLFEPEIQKSIIHDLLALYKSNSRQSENFEEFLKNHFGTTLYKLYFKPYNEKVWRRDLDNVPLSWLEGKLPMPNIEEILFNNFNHVKEREFVHSSFFYEKVNGSQYIADKLAEGLDINFDHEISSIAKCGSGWMLDEQYFDKVVFCGNIKQLPSMIKSFDKILPFINDIDALEYHGTTSVFCEIDKNPYSWIYLPDKSYDAHRIICTGNFSETNNASGLVDRITATVEFTDLISKDDILEQLKRIPLNPEYITHRYNQYTYPIQNSNTRKMISNLKEVLSSDNFFMTGRFADWEYYNMDVAIGAAMNLCKKLRAL